MRNLNTLITLSLPAILVACGGAEPRPPAADESLAVEVAEIVATERPARLDVAGTVRARTTAVVSSRTVGTIADVLVDEGARVRRGETLAVLDDRELAATVAQAEAGVEAAGGAGDEAVHGREAARAELELAERTHARYDALLKEESVSQQEFDEVTARLRLARAGLEAAESRVRRAEAQLRRARAQLTAARTALGYTRITAPADGVVTARHLDPGSLATPGSPVLTIEAAGPLQLEIAVPATHRGAVVVGREVEVSIDGIPAEVAAGRLTGRVIEVVPVIDRTTQTFVAKIALPALADLRSGMFGRATIEGAPELAIEVPARAVVTSGQLQSVFVVDDGLARRRLVTLGAPRGAWYPVLSGLTEGDRVALDPGPLRDGAPVRERQP